MAGLLIWSENLKNHVKYRNSLFTDIKAIVFIIGEGSRTQNCWELSDKPYSKSQHLSWSSVDFLSFRKKLRTLMPIPEITTHDIIWITKLDKTEVDFLRWYNFSPQRFDMAQIHLYFSFLSVQSRMANQWGPESSLSEKQLVNKVPQCEVSDRSEAPDVTLRPQSKVKTRQFTKGKDLYHQGRN